MLSYIVFFICLLRLAKIKQWIDENDPGAQLIPFSGAFEQKVSENCFECQLSCIYRIIFPGYNDL